MLSYFSKRFISSTRFTTRLSPSVQFLIRTYNIEVNNIKSTGPYGILLKGDLLGYIKDKNLKPHGPFDHTSHKKQEDKAAKTARSEEKVRIYLFNI
jgi:pyruvate/2-oxoglutarate dehydrogenase complex dihydrolipoamide acyltransferase (E2) component